MLRCGKSRRPWEPLARISAVLMALLLSPGTPIARADDLAGSFVQATCLDAAGASRPGVLPFEPGCGPSRPLQTGEPLPYRKHDWPAATQARALPLGYQASDSLAGHLLGRPAIIQTFDSVIPGAPSPDSTAGMAARR